MWQPALKSLRVTSPLTKENELGSPIILKVTEGQISCKAFVFVFVDRLNWRSLEISKLILGFNVV